jgi:UPF0042 nucleotide-binding protein
MRFIIVTGMSGAGKVTALKTLEDAGYFCVDNLPIQLIKRFAEIAYDAQIQVDNVAISVDIRSGRALSQLNSCLNDIKSQGYTYEILFVECSDATLVRRYKETRRTHPLSTKNGRIIDGIKKERELIQFLKEEADYIIDTSNLLVREFKAELDKIFVQDQNYGNFIITVMSFGFKYGIPRDSDMVFDVRFLPNPYYEEDLRPLTGNDKVIQDYVMNCDEAPIFLDKVADMVNFLIPNYIKEGKNQLVISIGCTGGKHRSVTIANEIYNRLQKSAYTVRILHRDMGKDAIVKKL